MTKELDMLKLENQLCFPLYAASREIIKPYKSLLKEFDLTYTQYIVMMVLWEEKSINVKKLGEFLYLDSGTLTPVLKKLEQKKFIKRARSKNDERTLIVTLTDLGEELKIKVKEVPYKLGSCINLSIEEIYTLKGLLNKLLNSN